MSTAARAGHARADDRAPAARRRRGHHRRQGGALRRAAAARRARPAATRSTATRSRAGSSRTARRCSRRWSRRSPRCSTDAPGEVVACGLDHQGESVLAWDAESGEPLSPIVVWQDKRSQEVLDRLADREDGGPEARAGCRSTPTSRPPSSPGCSSTTRRSQGPRGRHPAHGHRRLLPLRPPRRRLRHRRRRPASRTQLQRIEHAAASTRLCARSSASRPSVLPEIRDTAGELGTLQPSELAGRAAALRADRRPAGRSRRRGLRRPGRVKATYGTGVFVLAHVGEEVPEPAGGLLPTVAWSIDGRDRVRARRRRLRRGAMLEWLCRELGRRRRTRPRSASSPARPTTPAARACCPALAGIGAPWWRPNARAVLGGIYGRHHPRPGRAGGARGHRLAGRRRRRGDPRERRGRQPARRRRAHQRAADARASGRRDRRPVEAARRRRDGARRRRAGRGRLRHDRLTRRGRRAAAGRPHGRAAARRRLAHAPSTSAGASSCRRPPRSTRSRRTGRGGHVGRVVRRQLAGVGSWLDRLLLDDAHALVELDLSRTGPA